MFSKVKCPNCGAKNPKERMTCVECGSSLVSGQVKSKVTEVPREVRPSAVGTKEPFQRHKEEPLDETKDKRVVGNLGFLKKMFSEESPFETAKRFVYQEETERAVIVLQWAGARERLDPEGYELLKELQAEQREIYRQTLGEFIDEAVDLPEQSALGKYFSGVKEVFRDETRDEICASLRRLGIDAKMAEQGRSEENTAVKHSKSLGLIDIPEGLIRWVNVCRQRLERGGALWFTECGVPDPRLEPKYPELKIKTFHEKSFPLFGKIVDFHWKGKDNDLGIIDRLNNDISIKEKVMKFYNYWEIRAYGEYKCWVISSGWEFARASIVFWDCYQAIAQHLIAEWKST